MNCSSDPSLGNEGVPSTQTLILLHEPNNFHPYSTARLPFPV